MVHLYLAIFVCFSLVSVVRGWESDHVMDTPCKKLKSAEVDLQSSAFLSRGQGKAAPVFN
jgi:cytochrome b subunit of formate dehydrogenase